MTRRQLLALATSSLLPLGCGKPTPAVPAKPRKKGLCLTSKNRTSQEVRHFLEAVDAVWTYNWNIDPVIDLPANIEYVPMIYQARSGLNQKIASMLAQAPPRGYSALLGLNEPDAKSQGNTTVEQALDAWPKLEATGLRLGSPGCVHPDNEWMIAFMKGVAQRGLRVDFVCMHSYGGPGVESLLKRIEKVHEMFQRPIWITEFAVADWKAKSAAENRFSAERVAEFVNAIVPKLDAMDAVERYTWFHGGVSGGPLASSQLFHHDGSLTIVGEAYRNAKA